MNANMVDNMTSRLMDAASGAGPSNPLEGLILAGMTGKDALMLRSRLNDLSVGEADYMAQVIAQFAAACARIAVQNTKS